MRVALAWAGGVGSVLALDALHQEDVTLVHVAGERQVPDFVIEAQAAALGLPLCIARGASELVALARALRDAKADRVAFGYLRGEEHAGMFKLARAAREAGVEPLLPTRHVPPGEAARALVTAGARILVRATAPPAERAWLGRFLDPPLVDEMDAAMGRGGWSAVRTLVVDGPRFPRRLGVTAGEPELVGGGWRLPLEIAGC